MQSGKTFSIIVERLQLQDKWTEGQDAAAQASHRKPSEHYEFEEIQKIRRLAEVEFQNVKDADLEPPPLESPAMAVTREL